MITLHGEEVKVGDRVWHWVKGWGEVVGIDDECSNYPIYVRWEKDEKWFTKDGKEYLEDETPTLFWQPIEFEIPKKPKPKEKAWQWVYKSGDKYWLSFGCYASKKEALTNLSDAGPIEIEPYLPSEIERLKEE